MGVGCDIEIRVNSTDSSVGLRWVRFMVRSLLIGLLLMVSLLAGAGDLPGGFHFDQPSCFERVYSTKHLKAHPLQRVEMIRFEHFPKIWGLLSDNNEVDPRLSPKEVYFRVLVKFRDAAKTLDNSGTCTKQGSFIQCYIECDGGGFQLVRKKKNSILIRNQGFAVSGCDGEVDSGRRVEPEPDDKAFRLYLLPQSQCKEPLSKD